MVGARNLLPTSEGPGFGVLQARVEDYLLEKLRLVFDTMHLLGTNRDAESLHRVRVASRRLRVGLRFFSSLFATRELKQVQRDLGRLTRVLGEVRTLDVNVRLLRGATNRLPPSTLRARAMLEQNLLVDRVTRMVQLRDLLRMLETGKLSQRIEALIKRRDHHLDNRRLQKDASEQLNELRRVLRHRYKQYLKKQGGNAFHKFRIAAKHYRYALEAGQAVFRISMDERIRAVENLQDLMGNSHDIESLLDHLRDTEQRWSQVNNELVKAIGKLIRFYKVEHKRQFALFEKFLDEKQPWSKKVTLRAA